MRRGAQMEDLKQFRQWGSKTPGHPENFETLGIEVTTGESNADLGHSCEEALRPLTSRVQHFRKHWPLLRSHIHAMAPQGLGLLKMQKRSLWRLDDES